MKNLSRIWFFGTRRNRYENKEYFMNKKYQTYYFWWSEKTDMKKMKIMISLTIQIMVMKIFKTYYFFNDFSMLCFWCFLGGKTKKHMFHKFRHIFVIFFHICFLWVLNFHIFHIGFTLVSYWFHKRKHFEIDFL